MLTVNGFTIITDAEGYLLNLADWNPHVAELIAENEGLVLTQAHWEIIELIRRFYAEFDLSPAMRPLVKYTTHHLGPDKGKSIYLLSLFPGSPPKVAAKIAGLPRPVNCL
jgi:tRNA 2-thiouridine synthesizing protein E